MSTLPHDLREKTPALVRTANWLDRNRSAVQNLATCLSTRTRYGTAYLSRFRQFRYREFCKPSAKAGVVPAVRPPTSHLVSRRARTT